MARKKSRSQIPIGRIAAVMILVTVFAVAGLKAYLFFRSDRGHAWMLVRTGQERTPRASELLAHAVRNTLKVIGATERELSPTSDGGPDVRWSLRLPPTISLTQADYALTTAVMEAGGHILDAVETPGEDCDTLELRFGLGSDPTHRVIFTGERGERPAPRARLAVLLEDVDPARDEVLCDNALLASYLDLGEPFSYGVVPVDGASLHSEAISRAKGEVLLYLPMNVVRSSRGRRMPLAVVVEMRPDQVRRRVVDHLGEVTHVKGIVNYQSGLATQDPGVMKAVMAEARARGLFYVDAGSADHSAAQAAAVETGTQCLEGAVRLDAAGRSPAALRSQLQQAGEAALRGRPIVVMARMTPELLDVLRAELPRLRARGIQVVKASDLARLGD